MLDAADFATLAALCDRVVPRDEWPGAVDLGVPGHVLRMLDRGDAPAGFPDGLARLAREAGGRFDALPPDDQDALLQRVERGETTAEWPDAARWFADAVTLISEGHYADPHNGANHGEAAWAMIGYRRGATRGSA